MKLRPFVAATIATVTLAGNATAMPAITQDSTPDRCQASRAPVLCQTQKLRTVVWKLQATMSVPRTRTNYSDRQPGASQAYRLWVRDSWRSRLRDVRVEYRDWSRVPHRRELLAIARCETGGINGGVPLWTHHNSTYQGALGFAITTWDAYAPASYPNDAHHATPEQQLHVAEILVRTFDGFSSWPACSVRLGLR